MSPDLTKWPLLLVDGNDVTPEQADEILIRTANPYYLRTNDREWDRQVGDVLGREVRGHGLAELVAAIERMRTIPLEYLYNSRISSSWVGGPHGWCDWDGRIGCCTYNIGKWPSFEQVTDEWTLIAQAFPYLKLTAQLVADEGTGDLVAEWRVADGRVEVRNPQERIPGNALVDIGAFLRPGYERGVDIDRLRSALARVADR
ncbi:hypothetical protein [Embleya sp. NPDC005971]|uniref:hypothetical protein n=1 Tax=Embleya sp. NPDC005971 TaxID=3156724 RepID=UPI0033F4EDC1